MAPNRIEPRYRKLLTVDQENEILRRELIELERALEVFRWALHMLPLDLRETVLDAAESYLSERERESQTMTVERVRPYGGGLEESDTVPDSHADHRKDAPRS